MPDSRPRIFLTGATGLLAPDILHVLEKTAEIYPAGYRNNLDHPNFVSFDLRDRDAVWKKLDVIDPDTIVHMAALTHLDRCEQHPEEAAAANVEPTRHLSDWMLSHLPEGRFVFVSTDQVYSGPGPHNEETTAPINVYGQTKLEGEELARRIKNCLVLRTNFVAFRPEPHYGGLVNWLIKSLKNGEAITLHDDVQFSPIHPKNFADILNGLLKSRTAGVFNLCGREGLSKARFAQRLAERLNLSLENAVIGASTDSGLVAKRSIDMRMAVDRIERALGRPMPNVADCLGVIEKTVKCS